MADILDIFDLDMHEEWQRAYDEETRLTVNDMCRKFDEQIMKDYYANYIYGDFSSNVTAARDDLASEKGGLLFLPPRSTASRMAMCAG